MSTSVSNEKKNSVCQLEIGRSAAILARVELFKSIYFHTALFSSTFESISRRILISLDTRAGFTF